MTDLQDEDVSSYIEENDVRFIRLTFCDAEGKARNISVFADAFGEATRDGVTIDAAAISPCFPDGTEVRIFPVFAGVAALPWRPMGGRVVRMFCRMEMSDGSLCPADYRSRLLAAECSARDAGLDLQISTDCSFYLMTSDGTAEGGFLPYDNAGLYDVAPPDRGENIRREICLDMQEMGLSPLASHHAAGPGQNRILYHTGTPLRSADSFLTYEAAVRTIASLNGCTASFAPSPFAWKPRNEMKLTIQSKDTAALCHRLQSYLPELSALFKTCPDSYGPGSTPLTAAMRDGGILLCGADALLNAYLSMTALTEVALSGAAPTPAGMPATLTEAISALEGSAFARAALGDFALDGYLSVLRRKNAAGL